jgi:hypothetical protein
MNKTINDVNGRIFLAILLISGNYLGELLPCEIQHHLKNSRVAKYAILLFSLWYFLSGTNGDVSLWNILWLLSAFVLVVMITKTHLPTFLLILSVLFVGDFLSKTGYPVPSSVCTGIAMLVLCIGFPLYVRTQWIEHNKTTTGSFGWREFWFANGCIRSEKIQQPSPTKSEDTSSIDRALCIN